MPKKGKPMPIELQKRIIKKIILKRGNSRDTGGIDIEGVFDNLDYTHTLPENISSLESEHILLPVPFEKMEEYIEKQVKMEMGKEEENASKHELGE
jgi:hypothetical protein